MKWYEKYNRKISWIEKRFGKYKRKLWNDRENTEENCENIGNIWKKGKLNSEKMWKVRRKVSWIVIRFGKYRRK